MDSPRGQVVFENYSLESDYTGDSIESDCRNKSNIKFLNDKMKSHESDFS